MRCACRSTFSWKLRTISTAASSPSGMLMKKIHGQPVYCAKTPPRVGPDHRRDRPDAREVALHPRALGDRVDVAHHRDRDRPDRSGTEPLHDAERDERRHRPGETAEDRADQEQPDAEQDDGLAPQHVGELRIHRHRDRLGEQVDREQPRELREAPEVLHDRRHRRRQDRGVDGDQATRHHDREQKGSSLRTESYVTASSVAGHPIHTGARDPRSAGSPARRARRS